MKKLLVPTDFSTNATNALHYAVELANQFGSEITLLHLYRVHSTSGMFISVERYIKEDVSKHLLALIEETEPKLTSGARINSRFIRGEANALIPEVAEKSGYDLIIMGTQGASGLAEIFLGSNTAGVMRKTEKPVLAIPADCRYRPFRNIVLAMDETGLSYAGVLTPLIQIARRFHAKVRVYHKDSGTNDAGIDPSVDIFLDGIDHSFHYELDDENINASINSFVAETKADLLCMVRRERGFLQHIFHASATTREVFNSSIPLLVLHDEK